jgi:acetyl-CoA carboxylase carboxyltransferase component
MSEIPLSERIEQLRKRKEEALNAGSERAVERQRAKGKMLARERIEYLLDEGSFHELDMLARHRAFNSGIDERPYTDGVITGWGTIDGRKVFVFSQDFTVFGGALGEVFAEKIHKMMDMALSVGRPSSASTTAPAPASRRAWSPSTATAASSGATCRRRVSYPRSR